MNLTQLKYFHTICSCRTVSAAAEHLFVSQPSLSNAIKELEREFGVTLFSRHHSGMVLTAEGEAFYKMTKEIIIQIEETEHTMRELGKERKILRLGVPPMIGSLILPYIYNEFLPRHNDIKLDITEGGQHELQSKLSDEVLDMIFIPHNGSLPPDKVSLNIARLEIICCVSKDGFKFNHIPISPKDLENVPLVLFKNSFFQTDEIKKWFNHSGIKPDILLQTEQLSTVQSVISNKVAVGFMFRELVDMREDLICIPITSPLYADISLVWKKGSYLSDSMLAFSQYIKKNNPFNNYIAG
ncbi:MAG: LysR family transcriptional regulator [Clostridia bacterium]|nr:LysR family transcriptional regulator [Clostridia bacterium]